jgi:hypothetical protein
VDNLQIPDYRLVLPGDEQVLVEVKNFHPRSPTAKFQIHRDYLDGLIAYARLTKSDLKIAVYWSRWNLWSLNAPNVLEPAGDYLSLEMGRAMKGNEMAAVGDVMVGTKMPLAMRFRVKQLETNEVPGGAEVIGRLEGVDITCAGSPVEDETERGIAFYLMLYGGLKMTQTPAISEHGRLIAVEYDFRPEEETGQPFEIVTSLSAMFSRFYRHATADEESGSVDQIHAHSTPGALGKLIPDGYNGKALPLWILRLVL